MRKLLLFYLFVSLTTINLNGQQASWRDKLAPEILANFNQNQPSDIIVAFQEQADLSGAKNIRGKVEKANFVFQQLQATAAQSQASALKIARMHHAAANSLFMINGLSIQQADPKLIQRLAELPTVRFIAYDPWILFAGSTATGQMSSSDRNTVEWGVARVHAPEVWAMGYTGQGVTVGGADTGYDWTHPALQTHYRGWDDNTSNADHDYNWHDAVHSVSPLNLDSMGNPIGTNPCGFDAQEPCDDHRHGTHTMGTMTGDDGMGNQIGVAPGANWIGCRNMERGWGRPSSYIECFQWFLAPTDLGGQNPDTDKAPHVINNSWYCDFVEGCTDITVIELLHTAVINLRASGVVVVVSNGNNGSNGCSSANTAPPYFEESFSVGSTRMNDTISGFSSRGPVLVDGSNRIKPNISAPGQDVRSSVLNGEYQNLSGTSMAGPHVVGVIALILSARPDLAGEVDLLEDILEQSAVASFDTIPCGTVPGDAIPNNTYGHGRVDALAALSAALAASPVATPGKAEITVKVSPNPVSDLAIFQLKNLTGKATLNIFSAAGKLIYTKNWVAISNEILQVPMQHQTAGLYFWKISAENGSSSGKIVKK